MRAAPFASRTEVRAHLRIRGQVQGVGFRPFVYCLARALDLGGWVRNDAQGVAIEVQGDAARMQEFLTKLEHQAPPLGRIDDIDVQPRACKAQSSAFLIQASRKGAARTAITPDTAVCRDCLMELFNPGDRRYRYSFINCTHCGPRYTITAALPYDRPNTSMAKFAQCDDCRREYDTAQERRFHAQPNACPVCGPDLTFHDASGVALPARDVLEQAVGQIKAGETLAIKGLGGFHLVCDARNAEAVNRLRERKQREEKPFALMAANTQSVREWVMADRHEQRMLNSRERSIVLLRKRTGCDAQFPAIAPGIAWLGVMLPYTPLHYLLFHEAAGRPAGIAWLKETHSLILVMTSANPGGESLVIDNDEAFQRLSGIADGFVVHNRDIVQGCDDSVTRWSGEAPAFIRRARGFTPQAVKLPGRGPAVLAFGGWYKDTVCLTRGDEAYVSQHIGDLDNGATRHALQDTVQHLLSVLAIKPERVAHDLHPDFFSTRVAGRYAHEHGIAAIPVQHHHAHIAAVAAEHGLRDPLLGVALDGLGLGDDGGLWGGELLLVHNAHFERLSHLEPLSLPGGDRAAREPWRMAASALHALGRGREIGQRFSAPAAGGVAEMLDKATHCPTTSSAGRLFDAAAGLLGVKAFMRFEGQAAMLLEGLAQRHGPVQPYRGGYTLEGDGNLSLLPLLERLADTPDAAFGAALFHATFAEGIAAWVRRAAGRLGLTDVVLGGGCFLNQILSQALRRSLQIGGLRVYEARQLPPNDGGLSLGQAWVAMCRKTT